MYRMQESIFWNNYRPAEGDPEEFMNLESIRVKKKRMTEVEYEVCFQT